MRIGIVTDSTTDRTPEEYKQIDVTMVPLVVRFGDEVKRDWIDVEPAEFYKRMRSSNILPQTSQPSVQDFVDAYHALAKDYDHIISIHLTSKLSGTVHSAEAAAVMVKDEIPVTVIDSEVISLLLWVVVKRIDAARRAGKSLDEILNMIDDSKRRAKLFFSVDTMKYLEKGGRIGKAQAFLGQLLSIKPILTLTDGGIPTPKAKGKGTKSAIRDMVAFAQEEIEKLPVGEPPALVMAHADCLDTLAYMEHLVDVAGLPYSEKLTGWIGAVVGSHLGPGTLAIGII
ncbi:MAG: DegV family protein [Actinomycetota bacterium]